MLNLSFLGEGSMDLFDLKSFINNHPVIKSYKLEAKRLHSDMKKVSQPHEVGQDIAPCQTLMQCQYTIARNHGFNNWHHLHHSIKNVASGLFKNTGVLKTTDYTKPEFNSWYFGEDIISNHVWLRDNSLRTHVLCLGESPVLINNIYTQAKINEQKIIRLGVFSSSEVDGLKDDNIIDFVNINKTNIKIKDPFLGATNKMIELLYLIGSMGEEVEDNRGIILSTTVIISKIISVLKESKSGYLISKDFKFLYSISGIESCLNNSLFNQDINRQISIFLEKIKDHSYVDLILNKIFTGLSIIYSYFDNFISYSGSDLNDLFTNQKSLCLNVPEFEFGNANISLLHNFVGCLFKENLAAALGSNSTGNQSYEDVVYRGKVRVDRLVVFSNLSISDNIAIIPAQARSLGFKVIFNYKSLSYFKSMAKSDVVNSVVANTNMKIYGKSKDYASKEQLDLIVMELNQEYYKQIAVEKVDLSNLSNNDFIVVYQHTVEKYCL